MQQEMIAASDMIGGKSAITLDVEATTPLTPKPDGKQASARDLVAGAIAKGTPVLVRPPSEVADSSLSSPTAKKNAGVVVVRPEAALLASSVMIGSKPSLIREKGMSFLIMDAPRQSNLHLYIRLCRQHNVSNIVRVCDPTYMTTDLVSAGITVHEMAYPDGHSPPTELVDKWLGLVESVFFSQNNSFSSVAHTDIATSPPTASSSADTPTEQTFLSQCPASNDPACIAIHCVAGLGRAPVLVAIALIEFANMDPFDAVMLIRKNRRGAINETQMNYLVDYRRHYAMKNFSQGGGCCTVM